MHPDVRVWQGLSENAVARSQRGLANAGGSALAFHSVADGFTRLDTARLNRMLAAVKQPDALLDRHPAETLHTPEDFVTALLHGLRSGTALQRMIENVELHRWLLQEIGYDDLRLGGTSANMAVSVATLGLDPVILYAYPPSRRVYSLFPTQQSIQTYTTDPLPKRVPVSTLAEQLPHDEPWDAPVHWIFEYDPNLEVDLGGKVFHPPRANRFIAGWNPANRQLQLQSAYVQALLREAHAVRFFFLSGYHIFAERYTDGTTYSEVIGPTADLAASLAKANPDILRHLELASIGSAGVRREVMDSVFPHVDSVGLNEVELETCVADIGAKFEHPGSGRDRLTRLYSGVQKLARRSRVQRIHLHDLTNYLVVRDDSAVSPQATRDALLFASAVAVHRARTGLLSPDSATEGLQEPFSEDGLIRMGHLANKLESDGATAVEPGIWKTNNQWIVAVPHRVTPTPKFTVGLGDLISASAYVAESFL